MMPSRLRSLRSQRMVSRDSRHAPITAAWYDDEDWVVRYLSVSLGQRTCVVPVPLLEVDERKRLCIRSAGSDLLSPEPDDEADPAAGTVVPTEMTRAEERELLDWYGLPAYWGGEGLWGDSFYPHEFGQADRERTRSAVLVNQEEARVHDADDILRETIACPDGAYGSVADLLIDLESWSVKYLIVRALPRFHGRGDALISPFWGRWDSASDQLRVPFTRATLWASPDFKPEVLTPTDERVLALYYGFARNW